MSQSTSTMIITYHGFILDSYGGIYERGSREYTLDDFHCLQLDKMERYICLKETGVVISEGDEESSSSDDDDSDDDVDKDEEDGEEGTDGDGHEKVKRHASEEEEDDTNSQTDTEKVLFVYFSRCH